MKSLIKTIICTLVLSFQGFSQAYDLTIDIKNYQNDTMIVGHYLGEKQLVKDTLYSKDHSKFKWKEDSTAKPGMYLLLMKPSNNFVQFFVNTTDKKVTMYLDEKDFGAAKFKGSDENNAFYDYLNFLKIRRVDADTCKARVARAKVAGKTDESSVAKIDKLDKEVKEMQAILLKKWQGSAFSLLLSSSVDIVVPEFKGDEKEISMQRFLYYKSHFFDNLDLKNPAIIRTPFLHQKVDVYMKKLTHQHPDSLTISVDYILSLIEHDADAYRYYLADFLNKYAQMKLVGHDAIYVHMIEKYYLKGKAPWITPENIKKMTENADEIRPILIGKIMPNITTYLEDSTAIQLHNIKSPYTLVIFWAPDCGHCKKIMPDVIKFHENHKDKVKVLAVCTKGGDKTATCWPAVKEKGMEGFINTADEYQRFNQKIRVKSTPKIFILDEKKQIIIKDFPAEELERVFTEIVETNKK